MKNIIKTVIVIVNVIVFTSCTNLDVDINSEYTEFPDSEVAMEAKLADTYYCFRAALGQRYNEAQELGTIYVALSFDGDYKDSYRYSHPTLHNYSPDDVGVTYWEDLAAGITKCNKVISEFQDNQKLSRFVTIARTMRAYYHFVLMDSYGDVPILDHTPDENEAVARKPRKEVAEWLEKELLACIPQLPTDVNLSNYGKPTKWMAEALLAKIYLNWPVYTKNVTDAAWTYGENEKLDNCIAMCDSIISSEKFALTDAYRTKFYPDNGYQIKDFIYAMPFDASTDMATDKISPSPYKNSGNGLLYGRYRSWRKATGGTDGTGENAKTTSFWGSAISLSLAGIYSLSPVWADLFELEGDERNDVILKGEIPLYSQSSRQPVGKWYYKGKPVVLTKNITLLENNEDLNAGATVDGWSQGYKSIKFWLDCSEYDKYTRYQSNDVPIFRLADVILMKAEAITRGGKPTGSDTAESLFDQIRTYTKAPAIGRTPTLDDIFEERIREFIDENWARNDFIRFGKFEQGFGKLENFPEINQDPRHRILPVPTKMLNTNVNWTQNAGY